MTPTAQPAGSAVIDDVAIEEKLLQDGEIIILSLRPSAWYVLIMSAPVLGLAALVVGATAVGKMVGAWESGRQMVYWGSLAVVVARLAVACVQCMGLRYVLTNHRILRLRTLVATTVYELPLEMVADAGISAGSMERVLGVGDVAFQNDKGMAYEGVWFCVTDPSAVAETVNETIGRYGH